LTLCQINLCFFLNKKNEFAFPVTFFSKCPLLYFRLQNKMSYYKKIHIFPYSSISSSAINFKPGKVELLFSFDSGYQLHINFIEMNHDKKEKLKSIYKIMMETKL